MIGIWGGGLASCILVCEEMPYTIVQESLGLMPTDLRLVAL